jgi:hypothetical protein
VIFPILDLRPEPELQDVDELPRWQQLQPAEHAVNFHRKIWPKRLSLLLNQNGTPDSKLLLRFIT